MADDDSKPAAPTAKLAKKKPVMISGFEFVLMGSDGALSKKGISQIRAHTTRELHRTRRETGQVRPPFLPSSSTSKESSPSDPRSQAVVQRRRQRPGNLLFGSSLDPFHALPHLPIEDQKPGIFDDVKHQGGSLGTIIQAS
jgi:hypothetical protein